MTWLRGSPRLRSWSARALVAAGFASLLVGIVNGFIRVNVYETQPFAANAVQAFRNDSVKQLIAESLTDQLVIRLPRSLQDAEPVLQVVVYEALRLPRFEQIFRSAAIDANRVFFGKDTSRPALDLSEAGPLIQSLVEQVDPQLADALPPTIEGLLVDVSAQPTVYRIVQIAENARDATFLWPSLAVALFALGIVVAGRRRQTVIWVGVLLAVGGLVLAVGAEVVREIVLRQQSSSTAADAARAAADAYVEDAPLWGLLVALAGSVLAGAALAVGSPLSVGERLAGAWRTLARRPSNVWVGLLRAAVLAAVAVFALFQIDLALTALLVAGAVVLLLYAFVELLGAAQLVPGRAGAVLPWLLVFASAIAIVVVGIVVLTP